MNTRTFLHSSSASPKDIAARTYEIDLDSGASEGFDREGWVRAEQELKAIPAETTLGDAAIGRDCAGRNRARRDHR
jgi:hypothetical protein